jgi:hypothetical protein
MIIVFVNIGRTARDFSFEIEKGSDFTFHIKGGDITFDYRKKINSSYLNISIVKLQLEKHMTSTMCDKVLIN